jgi:hypothetical protein
LGQLDQDGNQALFRFVDAKCKTIELTPEDVDAIWIELQSQIAGEEWR